MLNAWTAEMDHVVHARYGGHASALVTPRISEQVGTYETRAVVTVLTPRPVPTSLRAEAEAMMRALGGEVRPSPEMRAALAGARALNRRPAPAVRRRTGPSHVPPVG